MSALFSPEFDEVGPIPVLDKILGGVVFGYEYIGSFFKACQFNWPFFGGVFGVVRIVIVAVYASLLVWVAYQLISGVRRLFG